MTPTTMIDEPGQGAPRLLQGWWRRLQWVVIPLVVFGAAEALARAWVSRVSGRTFLDRAERVARSGPVDFLFVGSSRVAASIDIGTFAGELARTRGRDVRAVNMGTGYATLVEHDFALRELAGKYPEAMKGCVVLIEAPGGIPDGLGDGRGRWDQPWSYEGEATWLAPLLRPGDLPALWRSGFDLADKVHFTARDLGNASILIARREVLAESIADGLRARAESLLLDQRPEAEKADLATGGGIRTDPATVTRNRGLARVDARRWLEDRRPIGPDWDDRVLGSIVRRVKAMGGRVAFFEVPLHSLQAGVLQTEVRLADRRAFREQARRWGTPLLELDDTIPDEAFPDIWHLAKSRSPEFTRTLAREWIEID
jgi:hypothetical protein